MVGELSGGKVGDAVVETPLGQFVVRHEKLAHLRHSFCRLLHPHVIHGRRRHVVVVLVSVVASLWIDLVFQSIR